MRLRRVFPLLVVVLLFSNSANAQKDDRPGPPGPPEKDAAAVALMQQALGSMGTPTLAANRAQVLNLLATGRYLPGSDSSKASPIPFRLKVRGFDQIRWEMESSEGIAVTLIVGGSGWFISPKGSATLPVNALQGRKYELMPLLGIAEWMSHDRSSIRYVGTEAVQGKNLIRLSLTKMGRAEDSPDIQSTMAAIHQQELYFDPETRMPVRLRYYEHPGDWRVNIPVDVEFSDFKVVNGILFPTRVTRSIRGQKLGEYVFESLVFGAELSAQDFAVGAR